MANTQFFKISFHNLIFVTIDKKKFIFIEFYFSHNKIRKNSKIYFIEIHNEKNKQFKRYNKFLRRKTQ